MRRRRIFLLVVVLLVLTGAGTYLYLTLGTDSTTSAGGATEPYGPLLEAREALLASPHEVTLELAVDIPKGSESDNPDHQEISAEGAVDFSAGDAELVYDYQGLANAAGFLGHFDTMDVLYADGDGYLDIFKSGPPWLSIEPQDAANDQVARLREIMLTTPMILPGLLEVSATAPLGPGGELSREVDPEALSGSGDGLAAGLGAAYEEIGAETLVVEVTLADDGADEIHVSFDYHPLPGKTSVEVTYSLDPSSVDVSVEAPDDPDVRAFSSILT